MYGFDAITANNGWAMAIAGALIVFSGLVVLSFVISQLHKILLLWEKRTASPSQGDAGSKTAPADEGINVPDILPSDIYEAAQFYAPLIQQLEQPFQLTELYQLSRNLGFPHPHLTLKQFQLSNLLIAQGDGFFIWHQPTT